MKINLWEAYNVEKVSVDISKELKNKIKKFVERDIKNNSRDLKINPARVYEYFIYQNSPITLNTLLKICDIMRISKKDMQENIVMYKQKLVPIKNSISKPKLPIEINPYLTSIVSNLYFDGSVPKDGKGTYYNQKREKIMEGFIKRLEFVFGKINYSLKRDHRGVLKLRVPRIIGEICKEIYGVEDFSSINAKYPKLLYSLSKDHKIAFLLSAILDEGSITYDGSTQFGVHNKELCGYVLDICKELNLKTTTLNKKQKKDYYYFYIKSKKEFLEIINYFEKKYPLFSLDYKKERLKKYFETLKKPGLRNKKGGDMRKEEIINSLSKKDMSVNELCKELLIPPRTLRRHLYVLFKNGKVNRKKVKNYYLYNC
jgi:DNA-binding transcriptional ArsR family regulator